MPRRTAVLAAILLLVATFCFAQAARNPAYNFSGKTNFTSVGISGLDVRGNPGYVELKGVNFSGSTVSSDTATHYYLWVDRSGDLCLSSHATISTYSSFPTGDWETGMVGACTVVGTQS